MELSIVIPTLNERDNIVPLVEKLRQALEGVDWEAIFVDDGSKDATGDVVEKLCRENSRIRLLRRAGRRGLSSACIEGMKRSQAPYLAVMDADMQHDETLLKEMLRTLKSETLDAAIASRYVEQAVFNLPSKMHIFMSRLATVFVKFVLPVDIKDPLSGFFMVKKEFFHKAAASLCGKGQKILLDLCVSSPDPLRFKELPYRFRERASGKSKMSLSVLWGNILLILHKWSHPRGVH